MANPQILLAGLRDYQKELERHREVLQLAYNEVSNIGQPFIEVYEGEAAEQFKAGWARTQQKFETYLEETQKINRLLLERMEALGEVVRPEDDLIA
jgi:uncharacterized protein YukE